MSDIALSEHQCDENSTISCECSTTRESASAQAIASLAETHLQEIVSSASAPPIPISEISVVETYDDSTTAGSATPVNQVSAELIVDANASVPIIVQSPEVVEEIAALIKEEPIQILEEVRVIDQFLEELAPEELNDLSLDEIISLKATTPLPEVKKVASKLTTSYDQYKAYLNYIQNGSEEQKKIGEHVGGFKKKVPGVVCGEIQEPHQPRLIHPPLPPPEPKVHKSYPKPTFYQFLQPSFIKPSCVPKPLCPSSLYSYPQNLLLKNNCLQPNFQNLNLNQGFTSFPYSSSFRPMQLNQTSMNANPQLNANLLSKGFSKPSYMGGFYGF